MHIGRDELDDIAGLIFVLAASVIQKILGQIKAQPENWPAPWSLEVVAQA
jgi:hypothetical protein